MMMFDEFVNMIKIVECEEEQAANIELGRLGEQSVRIKIQQRFIQGVKLTGMK